VTVRNCFKSESALPDDTDSARGILSGGAISKEIERWQVDVRPRFAKMPSNPPGLEPFHSQADHSPRSPLMFERERTLYKFNLNYLRLLAADLEEADMAAAPFPGANPPVWILGHLAVATDYAGRMLGLETVCPRRWHAQFAPGSKPCDVKEPYPSKAELVAAIENGHRRVAEAAAIATEEAMNQPHSVELLKPTVLKTTGDVLAHLMCTHAAFHTAQLSACRRKAGKGTII
jgi:hypothetical protein